MSQFFKILSLAPRGIRHKLTVAFALMSIIPMLVCGYLVIHYIFPTVKTVWDISLIFIITVFLILMGFYLAKKIIYPVIEITAHARGIVAGDLDQQLSVSGEDEISDLSGSLNRLSERLKENMSELRSYGEKIKQINMEINKKVLALSTLLQIGNLITTGTDLNEILRLIVDKLSQLEVQGVTFISLLKEDSGELVMQAATNIESEKAGSFKIRIGQGILGKVFENARPFVIDAQKQTRVTDENLEQILPAKNIAILPITSSGKVVGILGTGNNVENFLFSDDQIELIGVFAKQVAVALENDVLLRKTEELAVLDELTGLYNETYIRARLDEEIKRAISYQRPCCFLIFEVDNFKQYQDTFGEIEAEQALKRIAQILKESTTDIEKVARFSDHQFALVIPEKNKRQSVVLAENIRKEIERYALSKKTSTASVSLTVSAGISATPIDGVTSVELINKVFYYIEKAKHEGKNKITIS